MGGAPAPGGGVGAVSGGEAGGGVIEALAQEGVVLRCGGRQGVGGEVPPWGGAVTGIQAAGEGLHPGVEDQGLGEVGGHGAVPGGEQRLGAVGEAVGDGERTQAGDCVAGEEAERVGLHGGEAGERVFRGGDQEFAGAAGAQVVVPVLAEEDGEIGRGGAFVGVEDAAAGRVDDARQGGAGGPADPVMAAVGAGGGAAAVAAAADRHAAGGDQGDAGPVGDGHVLDQAVDGGGGVGGLGAGGGAVEGKETGGGGVARGEVGHGDGEDGAARGRVCVAEVADDWAVAGFADDEGFVGLAADADYFGVDGVGAGAVGGLVVVGSGWGFDEQVLDVGAAGGEAPGDVAVAAHHQHGDAGGGGAGQGGVGGVDTGEIPDAGQGEAEMGVAGQERGAGGGVACVDGPGVARTFGVGEGGGEAGEAGLR